MRGVPLLRSAWAESRGLAARQQGRNGAGRALRGELKIERTGMARVLEAEREVTAEVYPPAPVMDFPGVVFYGDSLTEVRGVGQLPLPPMPSLPPPREHNRGSWLPLPVPVPLPLPHPHYDPSHHPSLHFRASWFSDECRPLCEGSLLLAGRWLHAAGGKHLENQGRRGGGDQCASRKTQQQCIGDSAEVDLSLLPLLFSIALT